MSWYASARYIHPAWILSEFAVKLLNRRRRALHHLIAGTVVARVPGRRPSAHVTAILLVAATIGCNERGAAGGATVRDSAGITIVGNPLPASEPTHALDAHDLEIGVAEGAAEYQLHNVSAVTRLTRGDIVLVTGGTEIRWYAPDGRFRQRAGASGDGPGEVRDIRYMRAIAGDSILVYDGPNSRVTIFAPDGGYARDTTLRPSDGRASTVSGALEDGTLLLRMVGEAPTESTPLYRPTMEFALSRHDTAKAIGQYPGPEAALRVDRAGGRIESVFISTLPYARSVYAAATRDRVFLGSSERFQVDVYDAQGRLVRIIRLAIPERPVTDELRSAYVDAEIARRRTATMNREERFNEADARKQLQSQPFPPTAPAFDRLLATTEGGLWVRQFALPGTEDGPRRWILFGPDGRVDGTIDIPAELTPMHVDGDIIHGVFRGDMDVLYVRRHRVRRLP